MSRLVLYVAHPLAPTPEQLAAYDLHPTPYAEAVDSNIRRALRWLRWLRRSFPHVTFSAPWIAAVLSGEETQGERETGLRDCEATAALHHGIVLVGGRVSSGMARERAVLVGLRRHVVDLTWLGALPPAELYAANWAPAVLLGEDATGEVELGGEG